MDPLADWLIRALFAEAVLLSLGAGAMVLCRQPARRVVIARSVLAGSLAMVPFMILGLGPLWRADWLVLAPPSAGSASLVPESVRAWIPSRPVGGSVLVCVYAVLMGAMAGWTLLGLWVSRRLRRRSFAPGHEVRAEYRAMASSFGRVPELRVSDRARGPMLLGLARPVIVIPPTLDDPARLQEARLGLLHELEHRERGDVGSVLLASAVQACWPVLPMVWWIRAQLLLDQEFLADRGASARFGAPVAYASSLVSLASEPAPSGSVPVASGAKTPLMLRVLMLVKSPFSVESHVPAWWRLAVAVLVGLSVWVASGAVRNDSKGIPSPAPTRPTHGEFRLTRLVVEPAPAGTDGRTRPYRVMCPRHDSFSLSVEVWAAPQDLTRIEIAGVPLTECARHPLEAFHQVQIEIKNGTCSARLDGRPIPTPSSLPEGRWIEFRPAPGNRAATATSWCGGETGVKLRRTSYGNISYCKYGNQFNDFFP